MKKTDRTTLTDAEIDARFDRWLKADPRPVKKDPPRSRTELSDRILRQARQVETPPRAMFGLLTVAATLLLLLGGMWWTLWSTTTSSLVEVPAAEDFRPAREVSPVLASPVINREEIYVLLLSEEGWMETAWLPDEEDEMIAQLFF